MQHDTKYYTGPWMHKAILVSKPKWKRSLGRRTHKWKNNVKRDLTARECKDVDWYNLAQVASVS
jgi:hypothetical protein